MKTGKPNIILIFTDQLRHDTLGFSGHPDVMTPYLDTLAYNGIIFDNAYSACPSCIPARAELMTGLKPENNGRVGYEDCVPWDYDRTLAGEMANLGYYTMATGKLHVYPERKYVGFHNIDLCDGYLHAARYSDIPSFENQRFIDDYFHYLKSELGADVDVTDSGLECNSWIAGGWPYEEKYHPTNWVTSRAIDFLRRRDPDQPFFLFLSYLKPHPPLDPPREFFDMYMNMDLRPPFMGDWEDELEDCPFAFDSKKAPQGKQYIRRMQAGYYGLISHIDRQIGRLMQALREYRIDENTLIIFSSDHGEELGDHGLFRKARPYEGSCHIPLMISGLEAIGRSELKGKHSDSLVAIRDIMPTILDIAGGKSDMLDGYSLLSEKKRDLLHCEHSYGELSAHWVVSNHDKYIWYTESGREQYFDIASDPHEQHNLVKDLSKTKRIDELRSFLINELKDRVEGFVKDNHLVTGRPYPPVLRNIQR